MMEMECQNCGNLVTEEEYSRTGTDEYCEECPELECGDPRSHTFGTCECYSDGEDA